MLINKMVTLPNMYCAPRRYIMNRPQCKNFKPDADLKKTKSVSSFVSKIKNIFAKKDKTVKLVPDDKNNFLKQRLGINLHIKEGDTFGIGELLFINIDGKLKKLGITTTTFGTLFPTGCSKQAKQSKQIGNCWLVSMLNALMKKPKGKLSIYNTFSEQNNSISVNLNDKQFTYNCPKLTVSSKNNAHLKGPIGLKMLEQAVGAIRLSCDSGNMESIKTKYDMNKLVNATSWGTQKEGIKILNDNLEPIHYNYKKVKQIKKQIKKYANNQDMVLGISTHNVDNNQLIPWHCYAINGYDKKTKQVSIQDPLNPSNIILYDIDKLLTNKPSLTICKLK